MNSQNIILLFISLLSYSGIAQNNDLKYLNQKPPSTTPEVFAPNIISLKSEYEFGSVFNKDATAFFYGVSINGKSEIRFTELIGKSWSEPKTILSHKRFGYNDPFLSPDENRLYFISEMPLDGKGEMKDYDIWYVEKKNKGWSKPINAGSNINSNRNEYYISFTADGTMFYSSDVNAPSNNNDFDIYAAKSLGGIFQKPLRLSNSINTKNYEADVFIDPDESYIIFCAERPGGLGSGDLYISFKNADGTWTQSKSMGNKINSKGHELCPFVSHDGKYFFYTSNQDIYWVDAKVIEDLRE